jgi:tetratricopeptide (TPR) repeat protein
MAQMKSIEPPDIHHLSAAMGWAELGNAAEAKAELALINPKLHGHPAVLEARWLIYAAEKSWDDALDAARALVKTAPEDATGWLHQAYALRRVPDGGVKQAWEALMPAARKFPKEPTVPYNLACYACQMRQLDEARLWIKRALAIGGREWIKAMALSDEDLQPLWAEIKEM